MNPIAEPSKYTTAQVANRDTVLITPGSGWPDFIPEGSQVYFTSKGIVITNNPQKAVMIDQGTDEDVSEALFGVRSKQTGRERLAAVVSDAEGTPITEIALNPANTFKVMGLLKDQVPQGGLLSVVPKEEVMNNRRMGFL